MKIKDQANPFTPGFGELPPTLAGRDAIKKIFEQELERLNAKKAASRAILLTGPRGCGKTALFAWLKQLVRSSPVALCDLNPGSLPDTGIELADYIRPETFKEVVRTGGSAGASYVAKAEYSREHTRETWKPPPPDLTKALLQRAEEKPLLLLLDEAHEIKPALAKAFFNAYQSAAQDQPMLLVLAGTPDTKLHITSVEATFVERTRTFTIGRLEPSAAVRAIADPLAKAGIRHDEETIARAAEEAQHYPYFLQFMGEALWDETAASGHGLVDDSVLEKASLVAKNRMRELYRDRASELRRHTMLAGAAELALASPSGAPERVAVEAFIRNLAQRWQLSGTPPPRNLPADEPRRSAEQLLLHTGFVWQPESEQWEFGIPSLADHVSLAAAEDVRTVTVEDQSGPALRALLQKGLAFAAAREALIADAAQALDGQQVLAERFVNDMTAMGAIGPDGTHSPDGEPNLALLAPRVAAAALDALEQPASPH